MDRGSCSGNVPAFRMAVAFLAIESNEFSLGALRLKHCRDTLALWDVHVVVTRSVYGEERNVGPRERYRGDVAQLGWRPWRTMPHHVRQDGVEVVHDLRRRHR